MNDSDEQEGEQTPCGCHDEEAAPRRESRWSLALAVLLGREPVVPRQLRLEWLEYRLALDDMLDRLGAQLARKAKADRKRVTSELEEPTRRALPAVSSGKARVRSIIAAQRGMAVHRGATAPAMPPPPDLEESP